MKNKLTSLLFVLLAVLLVGQVSYGQTTINTTYLSSAVTDTGATTYVVLNSIGSGSTAVLANYVLFMDGEAMTVKTTPTTTTVQVVRHTGATRGQMHASGALVYYGPAPAFVTGTSGIQHREGSCTASQAAYLPIIDVLNAQIGTCSNSQWVWFKLSAPQSFAGPRAVVGDAAYSAAITDYIIAYTSLTANRTVTLPNANGMQGKMYIIKSEVNDSTHTIWVTGSVDGATSKAAFSASGYAVLRLYSDGANWFSF